MTESAEHRHVAIDARMAHDGGIGTYLQNLVPRIASAHPRWSFTALGDPADLRELGWHAHANVRIQRQSAAIFSVREQIQTPLSVRRGVQLFWAPYYNAPMLMRTPMVVTVHDVNHLALPELLGGSVRRAYARLLMTSAVKRARRVIFDSDFTRREAERLLGAVGARNTVVHLGVSDDWKTARDAAPRRPMAEPYFLYLGNMKRHKNVPLLLRAFERVASELPHRIVLIGRRENLHADPEVSAALARLGARALYLGEVNRRTVQEYVVHAEALVTVSLYEGFGLPPLEAMAAGCPCVVSRAGSLPEVCGDAALYCDPRDEGSVADALIRVSRDRELRQLLVDRGRTHVTRFSWDRAADMTAGVLRDAMMTGRGA